MNAPRILPLIDTARAQAAGHDPCRLVRSLAEAGASAVWWRDTTPPGEERDARARQAIDAAGTDTVLLVGGCCEEALAVGAAGAHVPSRMLGVRARVRGLRLVGASVHDESELRLAAKRGVDYATISPVFATSSKPNATALLGIDGVRRLLRATAQVAPELRLLALGGVELPRVAELLGAGLWGVAAGTPFLTPDPGATFAEWRAAVESALA